ncbi:NUDIX domain-containing protein [Pedobacter aquatilis]|uniref:NUDIX domain-containing protein n=1 Tax=Pedobacter aquatilis TaxID=351343 RepID=UPI0025B3B051|nr:NUDIX domain-containing protein [Pedobacter aquatilis]MDN3585920.1 NUDIX domain-containing protein [Pedobacter aquatilis]
MKQSAGILAFRIIEQQFEFFLVHPGGPFFAKKDIGTWTIPKGELLDDEEVLAAAIREFEEETSIALEGDFIPLKEIIQKGGKKVYCWAINFDFDASKIVSNTFEMEWPPRSDKKIEIPEIDKGEWFKYKEAKIKINERQIPFLEEVMQRFKDEKL